MPSPRETADLGGLWRLQPDAADEGERLGYHEPGLSVQHWREAEVPSTFDRCLPALTSYEGAVWFRRAFSTSHHWRGKRVCLRFEGVNYHAKVWVNGRVVGEHEDGFLPFEFPIHDHLVFGEANSLAVRVDNTRLPGEVPGLQRGWRPFGGILREVRLTAGDLLRIGGAHVAAEPGGALRLRAEVVNDRADDAEVHLSAQVSDQHGRPLTDLRSEPRPLAAGQRAGVELAGVVPGVTAWSPDSPVLYTATIALSAGGQPVDVEAVRFGFRRVEARGERLLLNGKPIRLAGFNRHEDSPRTDMAADLETARRDLLQMKEMGANFVRLCHYPHHPGELDLCDEIGLLVMCEIPLYWWDGLAEGEEKCARKLVAAKRQVAAMIARDRNHPAVILWSVSNETDENRPEVVSGNAELVRLAKSLDPTRLATHVSHHWPGAPHFDDDDVISVNAYPSWSHRIWQQDPFYDLAESARWWREHLEALQARCPGKPILVTEFGYPCLDSVVGGALGEDVQAQVIRVEHGGMGAPYVCGAAIWCWADHPWPEEDFVRRVTTSPFGVVSRTRRRKLGFEAARVVFPGGRGSQRPAAPPAAAEQDLYLAMVRPHLRDLPDIPFPEGFSIRAMRPGEAALWTDIERDADPVLTIRDELFEAEFGSDLPATLRRCFFIVAERDVAVGTISAWYTRDYKGQDHGRLHWFAIRPSHQGRGLARPALSCTLRRMAQWHDRAWLDTSTSRLRAIKLYLDFGFQPDLDAPAARDAWRAVRQKLNHPALDAALAETRSEGEG